MTGQTSVIIPCYNHEAYLGEAIESVYTQTRAVREIIVVDDGSTTPVASAPFWKGLRVQVIRTKNRGVSAARNLGVSLASGTFVAFLDADDAWAPSKIEAQEDALHTNPDLVAVFTRHTEKPGWAPCPPTTYPPVDASSDEFLLHLWKWNFIALPSVMVRRQTFLRVGGFNEHLRCSEDWELWVRLSTAGRFGQVPLPLCYRRIHSQQMTKNLDQIVIYHRRCRTLLMREYGDRIAAAGITLCEQEQFAQREYREHLLMLYFKRRLSTARRLLWDYVLQYPSDSSILKYAFLSFLPRPFFVLVRDRPYLSGEARIASSRD